MFQDTNAFEFRNALIDNLSQIVFAYQLNSQQFTYLNPAFENVFKLNRETSEPHNLLKMVHDDDKEYLNEIYQELLSGKTIEKAEFRIRLNNKDKVRWIKITPLLLLDASGHQIITGLAEDFTEFRHYFDIERKYSNKKNAIIQMLSHDLAGPMGIIQSLSSMVATHALKYRDEELNHVLGLIKETSKGSIRLIQDFVAQEFLESTESSLIRSRVNIVEKIREVIEQYQHTQQNSKLHFSLVTSDPSIYADIDEIKLMQVITNLISNSIKFTLDEGHITIRIEDKEEADGLGTILISVEDDGIGIPAKYHNSLFDKFTKARRPGIRQEPSVGLGMSLIKTIVEWHNGKIWFESQEDKGTIFYIELPKM